MIRFTIINRHFLESLDRFSSKHADLTPIRISFRLHWLLVCLYLVQITGCVLPARPDTWSLESQDDAPLPNLLLVRHVVLEHGWISRRGLHRNDYTVGVESESRFGDPDEEVDLSCIYTGLKETLPGIEIIPTTTFWEQVGAPHDVIELPELFIVPKSDRLLALEADVIVIAYHNKIDVEDRNVEIIMAGGYFNVDKETAAIIVIDLKHKKIIHGSKIVFEDGSFFYHLGPVPLIWGFTLDPPDMCNTVARQAGTAIAETMPGRPIRALVVVSGEDPIGEGNPDKHVVSEADLEWSEGGAQTLLKAEQGDSYAQYRLYTMLSESEPSIAYRWLCKSADNGHLQARYTLGQIFEYSKQSHVQAYVWYSLSDKFNEDGLQYFVDKNLTTEEYQKARLELLEWRPGLCEKSLGLDSDIQQIQ